MTYHRDGFEIMRGLLAADICEELAHTGGDETWLTGPHRIHPPFLDAMKAIALTAGIEEVIGPASGLGSDFFGSSPGFGWHQDSAFVLARPEAFCSVWVALVDVGPTNGCLEIAPGSHRFGLLDKLDDFPALPVPLARGDAVLLHGDIVHRSLPVAAGLKRAAALFTYIRREYPFRAGRRQQRVEVAL